MVDSKAWNWKEETNPIWLKPLLNIIWIVIWGFILQPFILLYEYKDSNRGS